MKGCRDMECSSQRVKETECGSHLATNKQAENTWYNTTGETKTCIRPRLCTQRQYLEQVDKQRSKILYD